MSDSQVVNLTQSELDVIAVLRRERRKAPRHQTVNVLVSAPPLGPFIVQVARPTQPPPVDRGTGK